MDDEPKGVIDMLDGLIKAAKQHNNQMSGKSTAPKAHIECLRLYDEGWKQNGFEHVPHSTDIDTFWVKGQEHKRVRLNLLEQQLWVVELDKRKQKGLIG